MQKLLLIRKKAISRSCISKSDEWENLGRGDTKKWKVQNMENLEEELRM
jgi:hypothetical protein